MTISDLASDHPEYPTLSDPDEIYERGYRAGVEAMRDALLVEAWYYTSLQTAEVEDLAKQAYKIADAMLEERKG